MDPNSNLWWKWLFYIKENYHLITLFCNETQGIIQESSVTNFSGIFMAMLVYMNNCPAFSLQDVHMQTFFLSQTYQRSCWRENCLAPFCSCYHWEYTLGEIPFSHTKHPLSVCKTKWSKLWEILKYKKYKRSFNLLLLAWCKLRNKCPQKSYKATSV